MSGLDGQVATDAVMKHHGEGTKAPRSRIPTVWK